MPMIPGCLRSLNDTSTYGSNTTMMEDTSPHTKQNIITESNLTYQWHAFKGYTYLIPEDKADEVITSIIARYEEIDKPWKWWVGPTCKPDNLPEYLERHGLECGGDTPYMAVELDKLNDVDVPDELEIRLVEDSETLRLWSKAVATGFGYPQLVDEFYAVESHESLWLPHRRRYVGFSDGVPVCGSCVLVDLGIAGIYEVATVPEARRRGFGTAITLAPLKDSSELGVKVGVLHSSSMGYGVYKRIGFKDIGKHSEYQLP